MASDLIDFLVVFIREERSDETHLVPPPFDETLLGSGTLVSIDNRKVIPGGMDQRGFRF